MIRLVVVDDDVRVRAAIVQTIELENDLTIVGEADDAGSAIAIIDQTSPTVILLDVLLPDQETGLALVSRFSKLPGKAVVAMSGRGGLRSAALAAGAETFVEKGGDIDALLDVVKAAGSGCGTSSTSLRR